MDSATSPLVGATIEIDRIRAMIPHRFPMLMIAIPTIDGAIRVATVASLLKPVGTLNPATRKAIASVLADCPPLAALRLEPQTLPADQGASGESEA